MDDQRPEPLTQRAGHAHAEQGRQTHEREAGAEHPPARLRRGGLLDDIDTAYERYTLALHEERLDARVARLVEALESLFGEKGPEVKRRVCQRAALLLGMDEVEALDAFALLSRCSDHRSTYAHGGVLTGKELSHLPARPAGGLHDVTPLLYARQCRALLEARHRAGASAESRPLGRKRTARSTSLGKTADLVPLLLARKAVSPTPALLMVNPSILQTQHGAGRPPRDDRR